MAENTAGIAAPIRMPKNTVGSMMSKPVMSALPAAARASLTSLMKAPSREMTVRPAAPMEKPLVTALTVLPALSSSSAMRMVSSPRPPISARPRALSTIGAVGVVGDDHADDGQHADRRHGDAEHARSRSPMGSQSL